MTEGRVIIAYGRYSYAEAGPDKALRPCVTIDFLAKNKTAKPGTGTDFMIRLLIRIAKDPKVASYRGVLIDSMNCGDREMCVRRWHFFTDLIGFTPFGDPQIPYGYAFMPMTTVRMIAGKAGLAPTE